MAVGGEAWFVAIGIAGIVIVGIDAFPILAIVRSSASIVVLWTEARIGGGGAGGTRGAGGGVIDGRCVSGVIFHGGTEKP